MMAKTGLVKCDKKQTWRKKQFPGETGVRVMAVAEGYVMARYKGCIPFIMDEKRFVEQFELKPAQ